MATHLTLAEREFIAEQRAVGRTKIWIATTLGRDPSTLYRERKRNSVNGHYSPSVAHQKFIERHCRARHGACKMSRPRLRRLVIRCLRKLWSPEQIAFRTKQESAGDRRLQISDQALYNWIERDDHKQRWKRLLRRCKPARKRACATRKPCVGIANRPAIINERARFGDWEGDSIVGPYKRGGALISLVERRSRLVELIYVPNLTTQVVTRAIAHRLRNYPQHLRCSVTFDRGSEFADHAWLKHHLGIDVYFADPGHPWQRGTNENTNGLVRQFFRKGTVFQTVTREHIARIQDLLNLRPRKCLGFQTPYQVLSKQRYRAFQT